MDDCIFCKVARGEIPATVVYQDDSVVAFRDIQPQAPVHVLLIPRAHYSDMNDSVPKDVICDLFAAVPNVARIAGIADSGYRVIVNTGVDAAQSVRHLHVHVLGGAAMSEGMVNL